MTIVIGGGFFGAMLAERLASEEQAVTLLEKESRLMTRASAINQARVHQGYHYPRAILTALRSRVNYASFLADFKDAVVEQKDAYYAIARIGSKVTARQFQLFCGRIEAPLAPAPESVRKLFQPQWIEDVFRVKEDVFDADKLRTMMEKRLAAAGVTVMLNARVTRAEKKSEGGWRVHREEGSTLEADQVYVCLYSDLNPFLEASQLPLIPLKQEVTEMALIELPDALRHLAVTVMCGPFFSVMPFPPRAGLHTLSHVRYTPHASWTEGTLPPSPRPPRMIPASRYPHMIRDAVRYLPALAGATYRDSLWEIKTVLPASETDDSRPILFRRDHGGPGLTCILGGKIDNVYDMQKELACAPR